MGRSGIEPLPPPPRRLFIWDPRELSDEEGRALTLLLERNLPFDAVQLRIKGMGKERAYPFLSRLRTLFDEIRASGRILWVNRDLEILFWLKAHGIQIGVEDPIPSIPYGLSVHQVEDLHALRPPLPVFLLFGHIYPTVSKTGVPPRGIEGLEEFLRQTDLPVVAVGGITPERETEVIRRGAYGIATIRNFHLWEGVEPPTASTNPPSPETT